MKNAAIESHDKQVYCHKKILYLPTMSSLILGNSQAPKLQYLSYLLSFSLIQIFIFFPFFILQTLLIPIVIYTQKPNTHRTGGASPSPTSEHLVKCHCVEVGYCTGASSKNCSGINLNGADRSWVFH